MALKMGNCGDFTLLRGLISPHLKLDPLYTTLYYSSKTMDPVELNLFDFMPSPLFPGCTLYVSGLQSNGVEIVSMNLFNKHLRSISSWNMFVFDNRL